MTFIGKIICYAVLAVAFTDTQDSRLFKRWKVIADQTIYLNLDGSSHGGFKDKIDSLTTDSVFVEFFSNGDFQSVDGSGTYRIVGDSVHLSLPDGLSSFRYELKDSSLYLYDDQKRTDYIRRNLLHAVAN